MWGVLRNFFQSSTYFKEGRSDLPPEAIEPQLNGFNCFSRGGGGSVPVFQRKLIATFDFPGSGGMAPCSLLWVRPCLLPTIDRHLNFPEIVHFFQISV